MAFAKRIVNVLCTLGPASLNRSVIERLDQRGVDLFRINLSHTPLGRVAETIETIKAFSRTPICLDTEGAQVRTGPMEPAHHPGASDAGRADRRWRHRAGGFGP